MARSTADIICVQEAADRMGRNPVTIKKVDTRRNVSGLSARAGGLRDSPRGIRSVSGRGVPAASAAARTVAAGGGNCVMERAIPWNIEEMTIEQAEAEYARYRNRSNPSTSDMRRETDLYWHIVRLRAALEAAS